MRLNSLGYRSNGARMDFEFLRKLSPLEYESLDSYLDRLADENAAPVNWILSKFNLKSRRYPYNLQNINSATIEELSKATCLSEQTIKNMTACGLSGTDFPGITLNSSTKFCPLCLQENNYPRVHWQFSLLNVCDKHNTILIEKCPKCNKKIKNNTIINGVCNCGMELKKIAPTYVENQEILNFNKILHEAHLGNYEKKYFQDLTGPRYIEVVYSIHNFIKLNTNYIHQKWIMNSQEFEKIPDLFPYGIMVRIFDDWPSRLYSIFDNVNFRKNPTNKYGPDYLFHFNPIVKVYDIFKMTHMRRSDYYIREIFTYLKSRFNYDYFKELYEYKVSLREKKYISRSTAKKLFAVDQSIFKLNEDGLINIHDIFDFYDKIFNMVEQYNREEEYFDLIDLQHIFIPPVFEYFEID